MAPLDRVLGWSRLMRESTFAQLLTEKFFPAWLDTLHCIINVPVRVQVATIRVWVDLPRSDLSSIVVGLYQPEMQSIELMQVPILERLPG
jgi:hypothetical protein